MANGIKKVEFKNIDIVSVFRFFGGIFLIAGLIIGLFGNIFKINAITPQFIKIFPFITKVGPGIPAGIVFGVIYGLSGGIVFAIFGTLYNIFAGLLGGLKVLLKEE
jgi:hypothetical protein